MRSAFIALGSNMPFNGVSGAALLAQAVVAIERAGFRVRSRSGVWQTEAWPRESGQPDYANAVVEVDPGAVGPEGLYAALRGIETHFGRERRERWGPRTLDLDIVAMGDLAGEFGEVALPHPRLQERAFVLEPLVEIAPEWRHPVLDRTSAQLLAELGPGHRVERVGELA